jgi:hypothetical protein
MTHSLNTEALTRYATAKEYVETIKLALSSPYYKEKHVNMAIRPTGLLAGFALELYLKSWLLADGMSSRDVEKFGHKLKSLHESATGRGFITDSEINELVDMVSVPHGQNRDYIYRYTKENADVPLIPWHLVLPIFHKIDAIVDQHVGASASFGLQPGR